jgi:plasmid stabilization system protein ParE
MTFNVEFKERVRQDLNDAFNWYEDQKAGLGEQFLVTMYEAFDHLAESPFLYAPYRIHYRRMVLRRFPYSVIYQVIEESQTVLVIAVLHQKRDSNVLFEE